MSESAAVSGIILRSRLISIALLIVSIACFVVMDKLAPPPAAPMTSEKPVTPEKAEKMEKVDKPTTSSAQNKAPAPMVPGTPSEASELIKARIAAADFFDPEFYGFLNTLNTRLAALQVPEAAQAQKQVTSLRELEKRLVAVRGLAPTVNRELEFLLAKGGALYKGIIPSASPFVPISGALEKLRVDFLNIQAKKPLDSLKGFQSALKTLTEAREKLNDPALAPEMNERRKAIVAKIDALTVMRRAKDWEAATFAVIAISSELNRLANAMGGASGASVAAATTGIGFDQGVVSRIFGAFGFIALLLSVIEVLRCDRKLLSMIDLAAVDSALTNSARFEALQKANEGLPYLQLAAKQISDLGKQLIAAIQKLGGTVSSMQTTEVTNGEDPGLKALVDTQFHAREIQRSFAVLKEQSMRLSLTVSQTNAEPTVSDITDRLADSIEHVESLMRGLQQDLDHSVTAHMTSDQGNPGQEAVAIKRDAEGLLMIASQWTRQFDRLNDALVDLERLLGVASSTGPRRRVDASTDDADDQFKREPA